MDCRYFSFLMTGNLQTPQWLRAVAIVRWPFVCLAVLMLPSLLAGCNRSNPYLTSSPTGFLAPNAAPGIANPQLPAQLAELERRAKLLDDNNRQLTTQLAQSQQQMQLFKERSELMQRQLADVNNQLQQTRVSSMQTTQQFRGLEDRVKVDQSLQDRRGGARLTANTSTKIGGESMRELGFPVEINDGVIRVRVPADQLFQPGTSQLSPSASGILDRVADVIKRSYARQRIAVEGHTDNAPIYGGAFSTSHQLAAAQSNAVLDHLTRRNQLPGNQLFTLSHGDNYPVADNQNPAGRASNRRIELVIYQETF